MTEESPNSIASSEAVQLDAPAPVAVPETRRFWTRKRVIIAVSVAVLLLLSVCGCAGYSVWRLISTETASMSVMRPFIDEGYPGYRIVDSTMSGYILRSERHEELLLDVRFENEGRLAVWAGPPREELSDGWSTAETFFRHAQTMTPDPRTGMNYDVDGFIEAYAPLRPGPNAVVSAVWFDGTDSQGREEYVVWVARRNRQGTYVEDMWPDHYATFTRDPVTGEWAGAVFGQIEVPNPNQER